MTLKLSEIKEQLEKCAEVGVWTFEKRSPLASDSPDSHYITCSSFEGGKLNFDENREVSWMEAKIIEGLLEQYAESRGYEKDGFTFAYKFQLKWDNFIMRDVVEIHVNKYKQSELIEADVLADKDGDNRLQATLAAFLSVDWGKV
jgi:hypothetical protein